MCRSPHGERGLKFTIGEDGTVTFGSLPSRGAWIEIPALIPHWIAGMSLPSRGAWIEIMETGTSMVGLVPSLPSRGAWIEITGATSFSVTASPVAPLTGSVD